MMSNIPQTLDPPLDNISREHDINEKINIPCPVDISSSSRIEISSEPSAKRSTEMISGSHQQPSTKRHKQDQHINGQTADESELTHYAQDIIVKLPQSINQNDIHHTNSTVKKTSFNLNSSYIPLPQSNGCLNLVSCIRSSSDDLANNQCTNDEDHDNNNSLNDEVGESSQSEAQLQNHIHDEAPTEKYSNDDNSNTTENNDTQKQKDSTLSPTTSSTILISNSNHVCKDEIETPLSNNNSILSTENKISDENSIVSPIENDSKISMTNNENNTNHQQQDDKPNGKTGISTTSSTKTHLEPIASSSFTNQTNADSKTSSRGHLTLSCNDSKAGDSCNTEKKWRAHRMANDYVNLVGNMMLPSTNLSTFGYDPASGQYPIERITALGILTSSIRRPTVIEKWSPYEISLFEACIALYGKNFHMISKWMAKMSTSNNIDGRGRSCYKCTKDVIEFYYIWKKTNHYKIWKRQYKAMEEDDSDSD